MKIEHFIREYQGEILSKEAGKVVLRFDKKHFKDYQEEDFNPYFVVEVLSEFLLLEKLSMSQFSTAKNNYLYNKSIRQPAIAVKGEDADNYTHLRVLKDQLKIYAPQPATADEIATVMKALEKYSPAEQIAATNADPNAIQGLIYELQAPIWKSFQEQVAPKVIRTCEWNRDSEGIFDLSLPTTLYLNTVIFDEKELKKLDAVIQQILINYNIAHQEDSLTLWVEFQNIQPKPKKAKLPPIDFESLAGKEILADDYFYGLTKAGWKYDLEESDLFYMLSKTFWNKGIKVYFVLSESCCVPPDNEETSVGAVDFFKFDKKIFKEKSIETKYAATIKAYPDANRSFEQYKAYFEEQYDDYCQHADFNTEDYELLQRIEADDVPAAILKEIWADLHSF